MNRHFDITTLPCGLRVASEKLPGLETVAVAVAVDVGARYEPKADGGISHLLEHMAFKGTNRRNARKIAEEFDDIGGNVNAYTSLENTVYYARVLKEHLPTAVDILADILQHSTFDEEELVRERQVILQEIAMHNDTPDDLVYDMFHETAYPRQALGRSILGTTKRVASFSRADLQHYINLHYQPSRMVVAAAGNVDHAELVRLVETHFHLKQSQAPQTPEAGCYVGGDKRKTRKLEQLHVVLGFPGVALMDPDHFALLLFSNILGGGMSSRLFQEVREKRGLAYTVYSSASAYRDCGLFGMYAATTAQQAPEMLKVLCAETLKATDDITEQELTRAKNQHKAGLLMASESASSTCEWIGRHILTYGRYMTAKEISHKIDEVTLADVSRAAKRVLASGQATFSALGPVKDLPDYPHIQSLLAA